MATWRSDYIITTLSSSLSQYTAPNGSPVVQAPFKFGVHSSNPANIRNRCRAYIVTDGDPSLATCLTGTIPTPPPITCPPCDCTNMKAISGSSINGNANHVKVESFYMDNASDWSMAMWVHPLSSSLASERVTSLFTHGEFFIDNGSPPFEQGKNNTMWLDRNPVSPFDAPSWSFNAGSASMGGAPFSVNFGKWDDWNLVTFGVKNGGSDPWLTVVANSGGVAGVDYQAAVGTTVGEASHFATAYFGAMQSGSGVAGLSPLSGGLQGKIDEVAVWGRELTTAEITGALYNCARPICLTGSVQFANNLEHWWSMGDGLNDAGGNGGIIYDLTGSENARLYTSGALNIVNLVSGTDAIYCSGSPHPTTPASPEILDMIGPGNSPPSLFLYCSARTGNCGGGSNLLT